MKKEQLEKLGLTEEQIQGVFKLNGQDIEGLKNDKSLLETTNENLEKQLKEANSKIEEFGRVDVEQIKKEAEDYKAKYEQSKTEFENEVENMKMMHNIDMTLSGEKVRNVKAAKALLNMEALQESKDFSKALSEQIESMKESDGYLFEIEKPKDPTKKMESIDKSDGEPLTYSQMMEKLDKNPGYKF